MARMNPRALERIGATARKLAEPLGLSVLKVEYLRQDAGWCLSVVVDREGGVRIQDCERLARPLSKQLDELDLISDRYYLEVTSPGVPPPEPPLRPSEKNTP